MFRSFKKTVINDKFTGQITATVNMTSELVMDIFLIYNTALDKKNAIYQITFPIRCANWFDIFFI